MNCEYFADRMHSNNESGLYTEHIWVLYVSPSKKAVDIEKHDSKLLADITV